MKARNGQREIAYDDDGKGPPLLLLHAFPFDRRFWRSVSPALHGHRRVISLDVRGFGESSLGESGFTIDDLADDVAVLADAVGLDRFTLGGLSMGGYIALAFAARHGNRLDGLILADTKAGSDTPDARNARDHAIFQVRAEGLSPYLEKLLPKLLGPATSDEIRQQARALATQNAEAVVATLAVLRDRPDRRSQLTSIACPTLIIVGEADAITPPAEAEAMAAAIPRSRLVRLPGAGHLPNIETPQLFTDALLAFL